MASNKQVCYDTKLVAMATSLEILKKEVQIDHLHPKHFHSVKTSGPTPVNFHYLDESEIGFPECIRDVHV